MADDFTIVGEQQLRDLARDLRAAGSVGKQLRSRLRTAVRASVEPMRQDVRNRARAIPAVGQKHTGLREAIARATKTRIGFSGTPWVRLEVDGSAMPPGKGALPAMMEGVSPWKHPVYGHRQTWVSQSPHPYFYSTVDAHLGDVQRDLAATVDETTIALEEGHL